MLAAAFVCGRAASPRSAEALLLVEADSGKVLQAENATYPWYPASVTKLMTAYVTLTGRQERAYHAGYLADRVADGSGAVAIEDGISVRHPGHRR